MDAGAAPADDKAVTTDPNAAGDAGAPLASFMVDVMPDGSFVAHPDPTSGGGDSAPIPLATIDDLTSFFTKESSGNEEVPEGVAPEGTEPAPGAAPAAGPAPSPAPAAPKKKNPLEMFGNPNR
jgi:hypothetical protein